MASQHVLPTPWNAYNLAGSPFFQAPLEAGERTPRPLTLFVGREAELERLRTTIRAAGHNATCQAVAGAPGVGKTTLVKELKARALADGYLASDAVVAVLQGDTTESLFGRVLSTLYETIVANRPMATESHALADAQVLVRATRIGTGGVSASAFGIGLGVSQGATVLRPGDLMIDGPRVVRDLARFVLSSDARGVVLHLNNLENLSEADAARTADIFRDLRDPLLFQNGLHFLLVGTTDAVNTVVNTHAQLRSTVTVLRVEPLGQEEVHQLLAVRYEHLRMDAGRPVAEPVVREAVDLLHQLFRGDLRGMLKALDDGVTPLLGLVVGEPAVPGIPAARPVTTAELRQALQARYAEELGAQLDAKRVEQLTAWGRRDPASEQTQKSLAGLWKLSQGAVSNAVTALAQRGYVIQLPRMGTEPIRYILSGTSRLVFG